MTTRKEIYREMEKMTGAVPSFFKRLPDSELELEWKLFADQMSTTGAIPPKYRELMGLAVASSLQCRFCIYAHTEFARVFGATDEEIENAVHTAKHTAGWSTYIAGLGTGFEEFKTEIDAACEHMRSQR